MRILHLVCTDAFAGVERYVALTARELARRGHVVEVIGGEPGRMRELLEPAGAVHVAAARPREVARAVRRAPRPDLVHSHMTAADAVAVLTRPFVRRPVVSTLHFAAGRGHSTATRLAYRVLASAITAEVAISHYVRDSAGRPAVVVPSGIAAAPPGAAEQREPTVVVVQRLEREKDTATAERAWAASGLAASGWELHILGDGAERASLEALAGSLGVASSVRFFGMVADVDERLRRASMALATTPKEGFGFAVVEAMAAGVPVVAADGGAHRETLGPASPHTLFPPGDAAAAGELLRQLAADPDQRAEIGRNERERYEAEYTIQRHVDRLEALYRRVLA